MTPDPDRPGYFIEIVNRKWRDMLRGYTDVDIDSARRKLDAAKGLGPGAITRLTRAEMLAMSREHMS